MEKTEEKRFLMVRSRHWENGHVTCMQVYNDFEDAKQDCDIAHQWDEEYESSNPNTWHKIAVYGDFEYDEKGDEFHPLGEPLYTLHTN